MILDKENRLSNEQAITTSAKSTDVIDLSSTSRKVWKGRPLKAVVVVDTAFADLTAMTIYVYTSTAEALTSGVVEMQSARILAASLTKGRAPIVIPLGSTLDAARRYLGLWYDVDGTATAGKVTAFITPEEQSNI